MKFNEFSILHPNHLFTNDLNSNNSRNRIGNARSSEVAPPSDNKTDLTRTVSIIKE